MPDIELSPVFLFGTRRCIESFGLEKTTDLVRHMREDGTVSEDYILTQEQAEQCARTGLYPRPEDTDEIR